MILVTVGTHPDGFPRMVRKMDAIAAESSEEVIMQISYSSYKPRNAKYFDFVPLFEMERLIKAARLIVTHDGAGSILTALKYNKPMIVIPRLKKFGECNYDNKVEWTQLLERENRLKLVYDVGELDELLMTYAQTPSTCSSEKEKLIAELNVYLEKWNKQRARLR